MIIHPLFKTLVTHPHLLAEHAGAYLELAGAEAAQVAQDAQRHALRLALAGACGVLGVFLAGGALLLAAALPLDGMPAPWALVAIPATPLAVAALLWATQRHRGPDLSFPLLRDQMRVDRELLRRVGQET